MNPSDVGNNDRLVVQEVLKEIAQYHLADTNSKRGFKGVQHCPTARSTCRSNVSFLSVLQSCCSWKWIA
jgi:hypothetical protein